MLLGNWLLTPAADGSPVRRLLDPAARLPRIAFVRNEFVRPDEHISYRGFPSYDYNICAAIGTVGTAAITERVGNEEYHFSGVEIDEPHRSRGYGLAAYILAVEVAHADHKSFATDDTVTPGAKRIWERFTEVGIAQVIHPFIAIDDEVERLDWRTYYGEIRVDRKTDV